MLRVKLVVKLGLGKCLSCIDWLIQSVVPVNKHICFFSYPDCSDNAKCLYLQMQEQGMLSKAVWLVSKMEAPQVQSFIRSETAKGIKFVKKK